ncbi:hypothetical protein [Pseudomonas sp. BEA3.1]|uniref:hypothetical protein n=1 Tax=Pseudomonas sp. BEA3.1 TaxID=3083251 RepID=UPI002965761E|nr:hypothetical protein [Pseudomonas sp. BEA3.1]MDW2777444.1 hypothetical protein [Pseudomonas sp. BEA3.1]
MEIALPAIIIFLIVSPGFIFRAQFKKAERETFDYSPFGSVVGQAFLWTVILHVLWLAITWCIFDSMLDIKTLMRLLSSTSQEPSFDAVSKDIVRITSYFLSLYFFCWFAPPFLRSKINKYRLGQKDYWFGWLLRMDAPWYYMLKGADLKQEANVIAISAIVNVGDKPILYYGVLVDYIVDRHNGELNRLILSGAFRWELDKFDKAKTTAEKMEIGVPIDGNYLVISYDETITLNIKFFQASIDTKPPPDPGNADAQPD